MSKKPVALIILDGFGLRDETKGNAVEQSNKPNYDRFHNSSPMLRLKRMGKRLDYQLVKWVTQRLAT